MQIELNKPIASFVRFQHLLKTFRKDFATLLADRLPVDLFLRTCISAWAHDGNLSRCTGKSILDSIGIAAGMGLLVNGLGGDGYLVGGFQNKHEPEGHYEAKFLPGYQGLIRLCYLNPCLATIKGDTVRQGDHFRWDCGTNGFVEHNWDLGGNREQQAIVGAWAAAEMKGATERIIVVLDRQTIDTFRNTANDKKSLMWTSYRAAGYRKAPLRQLCKLLPKSSLLATAMALEDRYEVGDSAADLSPFQAAQTTPQPSRSDVLSKDVETKGT
jgi:phage RecT family recombinase